ncbi:MAG: SRPBCC family protein [Sandaracinaceae bacterium]|nr:SRPBCC family protein [Sandaracinaceae bacterium]
MLKKITIGCAALLALLLIAAGFVLAKAESGARAFRIERHVHIRATPEEVFVVLSDLNRHREWATDEAQRVSTIYTVSSPASGLGASVEWQDSREGDAGRLSIVEYRANEFMAARVEVIRPRPAVTRTEWLLAPTPTGTRLSWTVSGPTRFALRLLKVFVNPDNVIGDGLERRLTALKSLVER